MLNDSVNQFSDEIFFKTTCNTKQISLLAESLNAITLALTNNQKYTLEFQLAIVEALNNIYVHAYNSQEGNEICIIYNELYNQLQVKIIDYGKSLQDLPKTELPDIMSDSGRGWWIIKNCVDYYYYEVKELSAQEQIMAIHANKKYEYTHCNILTLLKKY